MKQLNLILLLLLTATGLNAQESKKLTGTVIGTEKSVNYNTGYSSTTVNTRANAFDGDLNTFFATYDRYYTWCGLDLGTPHVITKVGCAPRNDSNGPKRVVLAVFEGANKPDFTDAVPLYMNTKTGVIGQMQYADCPVTAAFRYVRYVGPNDARCNVAEVEFWGYEQLEPTDMKAANFYRPTNLPVVSIHAPNSQDPFDKETDIDCGVTFIPADAATKVDTLSNAGYRYRGNGSNVFPKHPYRIKLDKKQKVFGSTAKSKKWTLINNYGDKTLMRNMMAFDMSRRMGMEFTSWCQPVDVFVNGEYKGNYQMCDQIEVADGRVVADCLIEIDAYADQELQYCWFRSAKSNKVTIKYPKMDEILDLNQRYTQQQEIKGWFDAMEALVYNPGAYREKLDLHTFLSHFIIGEFTGNTDTYWSTYMYRKTDDDKFYTGPAWDFDLAYENDNRTYPINNLADWIYAAKGSCTDDIRNFVSKIIKNDSEAIKELEQLWGEARTTKGVEESTLHALVDEYAQYLNQSQQLNFTRWPILSTKVHQNYQALGSYDKEVQTIKTYITNRLKWFDKKLNFDKYVAGVEDVQTEVAPVATGIYTLDGRKVSPNNTSSGIYIVNGKKVVK